MATKQYLDYAGLSLYDGKIKAYTRVAFDPQKDEEGNITSIKVYQGVDETTGEITDKSVLVGEIGNLDGSHVKAGKIRVVDPTEEGESKKTFIDLFYSDDITTDPDVSIDISTIGSDIEELKEAIEILNGDKDTEGSVANTVKENAKDADYGEVETDDKKIVSGDTEIPLTEDQVKELEEDGTTTLDDGTVITKEDDGTYTITIPGEEPVTGATLETVKETITIKEAIDRMKDEAVEDAKVTINGDGTPTEGYLKTYVFEQGGKEIGKINIPKDFMVKGGETVWYIEEKVVDPDTQEEITVIKKMPADEVVAELPEGVELDTKYIALELNVDDESVENPKIIYIPTKDLIDADALDARIDAIEEAIGKDEDDNLVAVTDRINDEAADAFYETVEAEDAKFEVEEAVEGLLPILVTDVEADAYEGTEETIPESIKTAVEAKAKELAGDDAEVVYEIDDDGKITAKTTDKEGNEIVIIKNGEIIPATDAHDMTIREKIESLKDELDEFVAITDPEIIGLFD